MECLDGEAQKAAEKSEEGAWHTLTSEPMHFPLDFASFFLSPIAPFIEALPFHDAENTSGLFTVDLQVRESKITSMYLLP